MRPLRLFSSGSRPQARKRRRPRAARPSLEALEDRSLPSGGPLGVLPGGPGNDPYTLYTYGDSYTGAPGQDLKSFLARYQPPPALPDASPAPLATPAITVSPPVDPGAMGPLAVTTQEYNFGNTPFTPSGFPGPVELIGEVKAPTTLTGQLPLIILLHGRHSTTYQGTTAFLEWPPAAGHASIPSYHGYDYLGDVLASNGYIVVSISANGINARDNSVADSGALARAQLIQRHLDIWSDLNTGSGTVSAAHTGGAAQAPFGTRFVGHVDLHDVGLMGHSRGGEGVVREYQYNQSLGSPYGIKAVFALAPIDFQNEVINNVPLAVLLPYNDGDVFDLQGAHFFDDSRTADYSTVPGDSGPKYTIEVMGADHNFYNTIWSPGGWPAGASDDGNPGPPARLTQAQQRGTGLAYMSAFFRTYLGPTQQFLQVLDSDVPPPPSASVTPDRIHTSYLPPDSTAQRRDINRLNVGTNTTTNTLGGAVTSGGLTTFSVVAGAGSSAAPNRGNELSLRYTGTTSAFFQNDIPAGARDERGYYALEFRVAVNQADAFNPGDRDFSVQLTDGSGHVRSVLVSTYSNDLFKPPASINPHTVLNTVRIPLSAFATAGFDLSDVRSVRFNFDQQTSAGLYLGDLAFSANVLSVQMSSTNNNLLIRNDPGIPANVQVVNATTSAVLGEFLISSLNSIAVACDSSADTLTVSYQNGNPLPAGGLNYQFGPGVDTLNVNDQTTATAQTFTLTGTSVQRSGSAPITFSGGINFVNVNGGTGSNTYNVLNTEVFWTTTVHTGSGADIVNVLATGGPTTVDCQGGGGADVVNVGNAGSLAGILGALSLENEPSFNTVNIDDSTDATAHTATIDTMTRSGDTSLGRLQGLAAAITWDYFDTTAVNISFGSGTSTVNVLATGDGIYATTTNLFNNGLATVNVGNAGSLAGILGALNLENEPSFDTVNIDDSNDATFHTATIDTVTRSGDTSLGRLQGIAAAITWDYFDTFTTAVNISFGSGTSTVNVLSTGDGGFATTTNLFNNGPATINVGNAGSLAGIQGALNLENEPNYDTVNIDDSNDPTGQTATVDTVPRSGDTSLGLLTGLAPAAITWDYYDTSSVTINGGSGGNTFNIESTGVPTTINGGSGFNCFHLSPTAQLLANLAGPLTLNGSGADVLDFFDQNNPASETYTFDSVPSSLTLASVPAFSCNFTGMAAVYLETNGLSTVNDASGTVFVDFPPSC
jgi:hypothetical protein